MSRALEVFAVQAMYDKTKAIETVENKLNPQWIKTRKQGKSELVYVGGHTVIRLLNKAFQYQWSFEIISEEIVQSLPKAMTEWKNQKKVNVLDSQGNQMWEPQPPVAKVKGRLTIPGIGVKEQYGSKVLIGGATEQESAFKAASTDALKKCASLVGIALELYGEDEGMDNDMESYVDQAVGSKQVAPPQQPQAQLQGQQQIQPSQIQQSAPQTPQQPNLTVVPTPSNPAPQQPSQQQTASAEQPGQWNQQDIDRLKELKQILGITDNAQLDPYVREFFDSPEVTFGHITPANIKAVNVFLTKKAEVV